MDALRRLVEENAVDRLKERDPLLFSAEVDMRQKVMQRLGWTDLATTATGRLPLVTSTASSLIAEGATDVVLLGMGGSSLASIAMERIVGSAPGHPRLHVVDTTCPATVTALLGSLRRESTFFIVASKSGTTIEPLSLYAIFRAWMEEELERPAAGKHFIAITDPGTPLEKMRQKEVMRVALSAPATVGGRYSALSMFGLAPAAIMGFDLEEFIRRAHEMEVSCGARVDHNPAAALAAFMADAHAEGRDKLTLVCSESLRPFALWVEQLVAESTGKQGIGVVPVIEYEPTVPSGYGADRMVIVMRTLDDMALSAFSTQTAAVVPLTEFVLDDPLAIGAEFVRWEYATALLGHLLGINPFDEPNVAEAKDTTSRVLAGTASVPPASTDIAGVWATYAGELAGQPKPADLTAALSPFFTSMRFGDYGAVLAYLPEEEVLLGPWRSAIARASKSTGRPICLELGPRYLHSTGQLHKGGPNTGVFLVLTARDRTDVAVPGKPFSLAQLFRAQAEGDLATLAAHDRRVMRLDVPSSSMATVVAEAFAAAAGA